LLGDHFLEIVEKLSALGLSLPMISQQGIEQSNSAFKNAVKRRTCSASFATIEKSQLTQYVELILRMKMMEWKGIVKKYRVRKRIFKKRRKLGIVLKFK